MSVRYLSERKLLVILVLINILNIIDLVTTYTCVKYYYCVDINPLVYYDAFYYMKVLAVIGITTMYYYMYKYSKRLVTIASITVLLVYVLVAINNIHKFLVLNP